MRRRPTAAKFLVLLAVLRVGLPSAEAQVSQPEEVRIAVIGMGGGAFGALKSFEGELGVRLSQYTGPQFRHQPLPDLSSFDVVLASFAPAEYKDQFRQCLSAARSTNPRLKVLCVAPAAICQQWIEWVGAENMRFDPGLAAYYGLSKQAMKEMLRTILVREMGRPGNVVPPTSLELVALYHPRHPGLRDVSDFLNRASQGQWDVDEAPRVAVGTWRHHVLFHQPKVVDALVEGLEMEGILTLCLVADDPGFRQQMMEFKPDVVVMTSHTQEPVEFWTTLNVPRIHALWFTEESMDEWRTSNQPGMSKGSLFHQVTSSEAKGATECLVAGGTEHGRDSGEEILPIPDRIRRIVGRVHSWIRLQRTPNADKRIAVVVWDREADKAGLLMGPAHNLNAPRSLLRFLSAMKEAGYGIPEVPGDEKDLLERFLRHGRQMGGWEPASLDRTARSGQAVLIPAEQYQAWFEELVPAERRREVIQQWGPIPGEIMVWSDQGRKYLVIPTVPMGNVMLLTQPLKGETITATMAVQTPDESLLPPTHHFLATYFWMQREFKADAVVHFGSHGQEWLFPGKQAALSRYDYADMLLGDLPNINPWLSSNISELLPCKRKARAVTISFLPSPMTEAGLPDPLANLESTIRQYESLEEGVLKRQFLQWVTTGVLESNLHRDLGIPLAAGELLSPADVGRVDKYLHDLGNELIPASMHVLGQPPGQEVRIPYLVHSMGKRYFDASASLYPGEWAGASTEDRLKEKATLVVSSMLTMDLSMEEALTASGAVWSGELPAPVREGLALVVEMNDGFNSTHQEIEQLLAALEGKFVAPGPSGNPERNPGVLPTGRNIFLLNPEELPTRASYELGSKLMKEYLAQHFERTGEYPRKVAFSLVPFATTSDFGITESQILYLMGIRPVWDSKNRVRDVEVIPEAELGRPRIDVFLSARSVYRDELPSLMRLLDKAIRLAADLDEPTNRVFEHSRGIRARLEEQGIDSHRAARLSLARMFGAKPEEIIDSHNWFFYLTERSGEWEDRQDLLDVYLQRSKYAYAEGVWGEMAAEAHDLAIQGTEMIFRSWYDNRDFVLSNKFTWWVDGTLSLAIRHMTGKEPDYLFVDVRNTDEAAIVDSSQVVQSDFRARLTNPRWIRGMMAEGYAGGNLIAKVVDNLMGWEIMREDSVAESNWDDVFEVYVQDREKLGVRDWLDRHNPHAFQKVSVTLLETSRKGFWQADDATRLELAAAYADSVVRHGRSGGPREGDNHKLERFVGETLQSARTSEMDELKRRYEDRNRELVEIPVASQEPPKTPTVEEAPGQVTGNRLDRVQVDAEVEEPPEESLPLWALVAVLALVLVSLGFLFPGRLRRRNQ